MICVTAAEQLANVKTSMHGSRAQTPKYTLLHNVKQVPGKLYGSTARQPRTATALSSLIVSSGEYFRDFHQIWRRFSPEDLLIKTQTGKKMRTARGNANESVRVTRLPFYPWTPGTPSVRADSLTLEYQSTIPHHTACVCAFTYTP